MKKEGIKRHKKVPQALGPNPSHWSLLQWKIITLEEPENTWKFDSKNTDEEQVFLSEDSHFSFFFSFCFYAHNVRQHRSSKIVLGMFPESIYLNISSVEQENFGQPHEPQGVCQRFLFLVKLWSELAIIKIGVWSEFTNIV